MENSESSPLIYERIAQNNDHPKINIAVGTLTLYVSVALLYLLNYLIYTYYHPDIAVVLSKVTPLSLMDRWDFTPEPVERMQFQLSVICSPLLIFIVFYLVNKLKKILYKHTSITSFINTTALIIFAGYFYKLSVTNLVHIPTTGSFFFHNNIIYKFNIIFGISFYLMVSYNYFLYEKASKIKSYKIIVNSICYSLLSIIIVDIVFYNVFHLATQDYGRIMETNAVFYSVTQVYAGKSLLVDINCQYGLYAWLLYPLFKLIGLSIYKFSITMGILNAGAFFCIYLGIKKLVGRDVFSLTIFMALVFWQFWQVRIPFGATPTAYFQYWPIRTLFPALSFLLVVIHYKGTKSTKRFLLPLLALISAFAILWNVDSGLIVYIAVFSYLLYSTLNYQNLSEAVKRGAVYVGWMLGSFCFVVCFFLLSTKMKSGAFPDFRHFLDFQKIFYVSGFYMLPMSAIHFWNLPALVYLIACIYCIYLVRKSDQGDAPVLLFLIVLGFGLFAYFQGRSYDTNLNAVMYPAIIILGVFCNKLFTSIMDKNLSGWEIIVLFFIPFLFLADGAFSMLNSMSAIHSFSYNNAFSADTAKEHYLKKRMGFITQNLHKKDTVIILSRDFESYYYAAGNYYNGVNVPGSTEIFFKSELYSILDAIKMSRYPVIYDADFPWRNTDTILKTLAHYTVFDKEIGPDHSLILLQPIVHPVVPGLNRDANTVYYYNRVQETGTPPNPAVIKLKENFTIEILLTMDTTNLAGACWIFCNSTPQMPNSGVFIQQQGDDLTQYSFMYGNGTAWSTGVVCKLSCFKENYLQINVQKNMVTVYNNNYLCGTINTNSAVSNSSGPLNFNKNFVGKINELKISNQ